MRIRTAAGRRRTAALLGSAVLSALAVVLLAMPASAHRNPGFKTPQAAMLDPLLPGSTVEPLITVGETLPGSTYMFESIPDGISLRKGHGGTVRAYVNHETSTVPFGGINNFTNAMLSKLTLNGHTAGVLSGSITIPSEANYQRFCSNFLASRRHGFERPILFTNEESPDFVNRTGNAFPGTPGEQAGVVVAYDVRTDQYKSIYGMGRHNHENSVALERYGHPVVLSGDDTFTAPGSQLYMYTARNARAVWNDEGSLWAFQSSNPAKNDYGDLSGSDSVSGTFIPVPPAIAKGDQTGLENWSNANNVFQFIRIEDLAYDREHKNVVYFADTGEPRAIPDAATGRLRRGPSGTLGPYPNGRIFKMVLDRRDPTKVESLSILIDGDSLGAAGAGNVSLIHQPDNVETTEDMLLILEDPGSQNQYAIGTGTPARVWAYDLESGHLQTIATVNHGADEGPTDHDASTTKGRWGSWEASGIIDASKYFGEGAFLIDVQAHTLVVQEENRGGVLYQREGGQLLLLQLPEEHGDHDEGEHDD